MTDDSLLSRLTAAAGIASSYWDLHGHLHQSTPETQRALLKAMGLPAGFPNEAEISLRRLTLPSRENMISPVTVLRAPQATFSLTLPETALDRSLRWEVAQEDGELRRKDVAVSSLAPAEAMSIEGLRFIRYGVSLPTDIPFGYHRLSVACGDYSSEGSLIIAPPNAYQPDWLARSERLWGTACHIYTIRSDKNWGIGDFGDLKELITLTSEGGGDVVAVNPFHALFPTNPDSASPYWPSSRRFLNPLYIDLSRIPELENCPATKAGITADHLAERIAAAAGSEKIAYAEVASLKLEALRHLAAELTGNEPEDLKEFIEDGGATLKTFAVFCALSESFSGSPWPTWPEQYQRPEEIYVKKWTDAHPDLVRPHMIMQWLADRQLKSAAETARGMKIGIMRDLAVGASPDGADVWLDQNLYPLGIRFGAPPDDFTTAVPPPNPLVMRQTGYASYIAALRANMRYAGALRIDHAMGLQRLFWIPPGANAEDGTYVHYPSDDLFAILALESWRHRCVIIGEDLGTVPEGFRERMERERHLSTRLLYFEREGEGGFKPPQAYPAHCVAQANTHDLPTLTGFWEGQDIKVRLRLDPSYPAQEQYSVRALDRRLLLAALKEQSLIPDDADESLSNFALIAAIHRFLARSCALLALVNLDDIMAETSQLNMPGTTNQYDNWSRKLPIKLECLRLHDAWSEVVDTMTQERRGSKN